MFMFWSKRAILTRRLLKAKVCREYETGCEAQSNASKQAIKSATDSRAAAQTCDQPLSATMVAELPGSRRSEPHEGRDSSAKCDTGTAAAAGGARVRFHHVCCGGDPHAHDDEDEEVNCNDYDDEDFDGRLGKCKELLKTLKEHQLELLLEAIESCGADLTSCIPVAKRLNPLPEANDHPQQQDHYRRYQRHSQRNVRSHHHNPFRHRHLHHLTRHRSRCRHCDFTHAIDDEVLDDSSGDDSNQTPNCTRTSLLPTPAHLLSCQIWRWPDLTHTSELKRLPICHCAKDPSFVCCNPYHWSRLCKSESPPPPYRLIPATSDATKLEATGCAVESSQTDSRRCGNATAPSRLPESLSTDGEGDSDRKEWCKLAYWELSNRIGRLYPVEQSIISVFDSMHYGDGLCLSSLTENHVSSPAVRRTRSQIGLGLMLSLEDDGIWAYNRSANPIFVNSPTLDDPESRTLLVYRVPPGFCLNIYDLTKSPHVRVKYDDHPPTGPIDMNSVRISFAKGWGPKYLRQEVTSCPCWLEVLLAPCRLQFIACYRELRGSDDDT